MHNVLFHSCFQRLLVNASGRDLILWYTRHLRELGAEYEEEVRVVRAQMENHSVVHRRRCRDLYRFNQPK